MKAKNNNKKIYIVSVVQNNEQDAKIVEKVNDYLDEYSGDTDIINIKAYLELVSDNIEEGINLLEFVLKKCPFSIDALFLLGQAYNEVRELLWSSFFVTLRPNFCHRVYATP